MLLGVLIVTSFLVQGSAVMDGMALTFSQFGPVIIVLGGLALMSAIGFWVVSMIGGGTSAAVAGGRGGSSARGVRSSLSRHVVASMYKGSSILGTVGKTSSGWGLRDSGLVGGFHTKSSSEVGPAARRSGFYQGRHGSNHGTDVTLRGLFGSGKHSKK